MATHKTGYCDFHHAEYAAAKRRHNDWRYNYATGRTSHRPTTWDEYLGDLHFTPMAEATSALDERVTTVIEGVLDEIERARNIYSKSVGSPPELGLALDRIKSTLRILVYSNETDRVDDAPIQ